jgi:hypothetical protein
MFSNYIAVFSQKRDISNHFSITSKQEEWCRVASLTIPDELVYMVKDEFEYFVFLCILETHMCSDDLKVFSIHPSFLYHSYRVKNNLYAVTLHKSVGTKNCLTVLKLLIGCHSIRVLEH